MPPPSSDPFGGEELEALATAADAFAGLGDPADPAAPGGGGDLAGLRAELADLRAAVAVLLARSAEAEFPGRAPVFMARDGVAGGWQELAADVDELVGMPGGRVGDAADDAPIDAAGAFPLMAVRDAAGDRVRYVPLGGNVVLIQITGTEAGDRVYTARVLAMPTADTDPAVDGANPNVTVGGDCIGLSLLENNDGTLTHDADVGDVYPAVRGRTNDDGTPVFYFWGIACSPC